MDFPRFAEALPQVMAGVMSNLNVRFATKGFDSNVILVHIDNAEWQCHRDSEVESVQGSRYGW